MKTLNLIEAAQFLKMHPEEVRRRAKSGIIPGANLGKRWAFIEDDLADHIRARYMLALGKRCKWDIRRKVYVTL
jgi:hypothetical protein